MKYTIKIGCGHIEERELHGSSRYIEDTIKFLKTSICGKCYMKEQLKNHLAAGYKEVRVSYPHQQQLVCKIGDSQKQRNGVLCSVTGFPSVVVPAGFTAASDTAPIGVPVGMEFIGEPWSEKRLLLLAHAYEKAANMRKPPVL